MFFLASKNLFQEKTRFLISAGGVAFSVFLMILLQSLNIGYSNIIGRFFEDISADIWVTHTNYGNVMDMTILPLSLESKLEHISGVASAKPYTMQGLTTKVNGKSSEFYFVSYDPAHNVGQPPKVSAGKRVPGPGEIVIDRITAKTDHVKLGDRIQISGRRLKVVGFSDDTFMLTASIGFINQQDVSQILEASGTTNYWLIQVKPDANMSAVKSAINSQVPSVEAHTKDQIIASNNKAISGFATPVFSALVVLGAIIGTAVIGLTIFTSTIEKAREYGILEAIGLKNKQLYIIVFEQALIMAVVGFAVGAALIYALKPVITSAEPMLVMDLRFIDIAWIFGATLVMAVVASFIPIRRLSKIDPAEVFRA